MGDTEVAVANIDDKGFYGLMENKPVMAAASSNPSLQVSVSFGRFENDSLSWEKFSAFSPNKYLEEVGKYATPGSVAQKKAYFEAHYKKIAERKAEMMDHEKQMNKNASFRSIITDQGSMEGENGGSETETVVDEGSNGQFICEEDKHMTDIAAEVSTEELNEETVIVKECQISVDQLKEEVTDSLESPKLEISEEIVPAEEKLEVVVHMQEKPEEVLQMDVEEKREVREEMREKIPSKHDTEDTNQRPVREVKKEKKQNVIKKIDRNVQINPTRGSLKPNQVTTKPETKKIVASKKTPPSKEIRNMMKGTKKPAASISKAPPVLSTPKVYKPASQITSLSTSYSSVKKENVSGLLRNKQNGPKSLHISMSLGPSATSDPTALTNTRRSSIMERMGDKDIVKRAFKTFQKSFDFKTTSNDVQSTIVKQNPTKATSIPSVATRLNENGRPTKASSMEKRSSTNAHHSSSRGLKSNLTAKKQEELSKSSARPVEKTHLHKNPKAGVIDAKTRRETLNPKAKPMQGSLAGRTLPKGSLEKVLG